MTAVAAAATAPSSILVTSASLSAVAASAVQPASTTVVPQPAFAVGISGNTASSPTPATISATAGQVSDVMEAISFADSLLFAYNHMNWNAVYEQGGESAIEQGAAKFARDIASVSANATALASDLGIKVKSTIVLPTEASPVITGSITAAPFTFSSQGSTYAVSTTANGNAVGTQDGQPWQPWGLGPPVADVPSTVSELLSLMTSFEDNSAATNSSVSIFYSKVDMFL